MAKIRHWLVKSEPDAFSIDDLAAAGTEPWDGIRNYQARNMMRDDMAVGDRVLFYHSNAKPPGVVGLAEVASEPYPDPTAFDPDSKYYDPTSDPDDPRWILVDMRYVAHLPRLVPLDELKQKKSLVGMPLLAKGQRLSVMPVEKKHYDAIVALASKPAPGN
ncbi:MAG: EVE domain-containing protein [Acidimicrobiales bacterium]